MGAGSAVTMIFQKTTIQILNRMNFIQDLKAIILSETH
jgi:hypothetical protein